MGPFSLAVRRRRWCIKNLYFTPVAKDKDVACSTCRRTSSTVAAGFAARIVRNAVRVSMDRFSFFAECFNRRLAFLIHFRRRPAFNTSSEQSAGTRTPQAGTCELADEPRVSSCAWAASGLSARITVAINDALFDPHVERNPGGGWRAITRAPNSCSPRYSRSRRRSWRMQSSLSGRLSRSTPTRRKR